MTIVESVVESVNVILKTLECAVCLELLKTPVTTGCGHFFCKFCITEVLKSNYRSPCPLCKRSFTRRSIQEAEQRQSVILAAKELAEALGQHTGVKISSKNVTQKDLKKDNSSCATPSTKSVQESCKTSASKKRKSYENEANDETTADKSKEKSRKSAGSVETLVDCVSSNDEVILSTNKRHRLSNVDSDDELLGLPSLDDIMKSKGNEERKSVDVQLVASKSNSKEFPIVRIERVSNSQISSQCNLEKIDNDISVIPDSDLSNVTVQRKTTVKDKEKNNAAETAASEHEIRKMSKVKRKMPVNNRGCKFRNKVLNENEKNKLKNKTNQLNLQAKNVLVKPLERNAKSVEKEDEYEFNDEELIKENKEMDVELYTSPKKSAKKGIPSSPSVSKDKNVSKKRLSKLQNKKHKALTSSTSAEEEILVSNLKEAENFNLVISKSKRSSDAANKDDVNECYNLKETNLPPLNETSDYTSKDTTFKPQKEHLQLDEIADTAVSVQTVASPEAFKADLVMKSPGWSRVKQVGKDFRVRKFSRLHVEKNTSNSCPLEGINIDLDSVADNIPSTDSICQKKPKIFSDYSSKDIGKNDNCNEKKRELPEIASSAGHKSAASSEKIESVGKIPKFKVITAVNEHEDEDCSENGFNDEANEMPTLDKETVVPDEDDINRNNHETSLPTLSINDISCSKISGTFEFQVADVDETSLSNSKNADKINDNGKEILPADILNYGTEVIALPVSEKNTLCSEAIQMQTEENPSIENYNHLNIPSNLQPPAFNAKDNFGIDSMEVDEIQNAGMNGDVPSFHQNADPQSSYLQGSYHDENTFGKQNISDMQAIDVHKFVKETEPVNVYYSEFAQQTSQRLLNFCDNNQQQKTLVPYSSAVKQPNVMFKQKELCERSGYLLNQLEKFSTAMFNPPSTEKTKVLKRTCLTLEEIQEAFANSNASGNPETLCSLPFSFGEFKLNVCVSEETLNISVVKIVENEVPHNVQTRVKTLLVSEKNVQTSNNNSPVPSPTAVLPSSNVESESSQPESQPKSDNAKKSINPYPFLSEYFSDSEPSEQVVSEAKEMPLNDSEVFPFMGSATKLNKMQGKVPNEKKVYATNENLSAQISATVRDDPLTNLDASQNLPVTQPYEEVPSKSCSVLEKDEELEAPIEEETTSPTRKPTAYVYRNTRRVSESPILMGNDPNPEKVTEEKKTSSVKKSVNNSLSFENKFSNDNNRRTTTAQINYQQIFDDSEGFSSDPDMAYAMDLVAPLKDIAEKMEAAEKKDKSYEAGLSGKKELPSMRFSYALKERNPIETFEELILSKNKDTSQSSSHRTSRLSLKSKKTAKKFRRIQTCESDDDSDGFESSKNESVLVSNSSRGLQAKKISLDKSHETPLSKNIQISSPEDNNKADSSNATNQKSHDVPGDSLQDNSTFNSCLSEDIPNNSNEIAMEIEDLDLKILSVVEKLKQCGHENVLVAEKQNQPKTPRKSVKLVGNEEGCGDSSGSEDSTDIFSQSVPPTPDKALNSSNSVFKSVVYNNK